MSIVDKNNKIKKSATNRDILEAIYYLLSEVETGNNNNEQFVNEDELEEMSEYFIKEGK